MALRLLLTVLVVAAAAHAAPISKMGCITDCVGRTTGDYQSCLGCHVYASCVSGNLFDNRPCPTGLVWDDNAKRCLTTSTTCHTTTTTKAAPTTTSTIPPTGTHPSSTATPIPERTTEASSDVTTQVISQHELCITDCVGHTTGDYQSCLGCHVYASCVSGNLFDNRPCPTGLVWDDNAKSCLTTSSTCHTTTTTRAPTTTTTHPSRPSPSPSTSWPEITTEATTGVMGEKSSSRGLCVSSCSGRKDGDYQSCNGCNIYASCLNGILIDNRPCPSGLVWDDKAKQCLGSSSTCPASTTTKGPTTTTTRSPPTNNTMVPSTTQPEFTTGSKSSPSSTIAASPSSSLPEGTTVATSDVQVKVISNQGPCITDCIGRTTGDYQSCLGCHVYASCVSGNLFDNRPCPTGLVWDDNAKSCLTTSTTCHTTTTTKAATTTTSTIPPTGTRPSSTATPIPEHTTEPSSDVTSEVISQHKICITDCVGRTTGDYQSCLGCHVYASCVSGNLFDNRPCPTGLVWDDNAKRCLTTSTTCHTTTTTKAAPTTTSTIPPTGTHPSSTTTPIPERTTQASSDVTTQVISQHELCITDCIGRTTGDYQSCLGCHVYASCVSGNLFDNRPCPTGLVWDDNAKRCLTTSTTCHTTTTTKAATTTTTHPSTPSPSTSLPEITTEATTGVMGEKSSSRGLCVSSCSGRKDGDYQSCNGCNVYVSCVNGMLINNRPCPAGLVWDDNAKTCLRTSSTCQTTTTTKVPTTTTTAKVGGTHPASTTHPETTATHTDAPYTTQGSISRAPHH